MKLLFITYDFYPNFSANSLIINNLSQAFIRMGHEVDILTLKSDNNNQDEEQWNDIRIHRIRETFDKNQVKEYINQHKLIHAIKLLSAILGDYFNHKEYLKNYWSYFSTIRLKEILEKKHIHAVINVCYPFESCLPIIKYLKIYPKNFIWMIYMQDPFATNYYYINKYQMADLMQFQTQVLQITDKVIVTAPIMREILADNSGINLNKFKVLNFPVVQKLRKTLVEEDIIFPKNYVNCVFVGRFNQETRNPRVLFQMFENLKRDHIRLHIIGEDKERWSSYLSEGESNIFFYGSRSREVAINAELNAHILINLGNSIPNQLPSKTLEYISTGKPIVNLFKVENCPSLEYLSRYPCCLNIFESRIDRRTLDDLVYFCIRYRKVNIEYRIIRRRYYECTVEYVGNEFLTLCNELHGINQQLI